MEITYGFTYKIPDRGAPGKIEFSTEDDQFFYLVKEMIETCVDAISWRNRVEREPDRVI